MAVTSDMGAMNKKMWGEFGISVKKKVRIYSIAHPSCNTRKVYFMADPPHVLKNIRNFLISKQVFTLPPEILAKHNLPSNSISIKAVQELWSEESQLVYKLGKGLSKDMLNPGKFDKMKVSIAKQLFDKRVEAAILYFVSKGRWEEERKTVAWFLGVIRQWFDLMTSRTPKLAISRFDTVKYEENLQFLRDVIEIFQLSSFGDKWKPIQTAVLMRIIGPCENRENFFFYSIHSRPKCT
jgi:hypothetical protein